MSLTTRHLSELTPATPAEAWDLAVVIDVIRAFTVAPWVLRRGAARLLLAPGAPTALDVRDQEHPRALLLTDRADDPRFALPNAPGAIATMELTSRTVIQTTGNGTRGAHAVRGVPTVLCASFATASATAAVMRGHRRILLVPTEGDEDVALADYLTDLMAGEAPDPGPYLARVANSAAGRECRERGADPAYPGVHADDLRLCQQLDASGHALRVRDAGRLLEVEPI